MNFGHRSKKRARLSKFGTSQLEFAASARSCCIAKATFCTRVQSWSPSNNGPHSVGKYTFRLCRRQKHYSKNCMAENWRHGRTFKIGLLFWSVTIFFASVCADLFFRTGVSASLVSITGRALATVLRGESSKARRLRIFSLAKYVDLHPSVSGSNREEIVATSGTCVSESPWRNWTTSVSCLLRGTVRFYRYSGQVGRDLLTRRVGDTRPYFWRCSTVFVMAYSWRIGQEKADESLMDTRIGRDSAEKRQSTRPSWFGFA